VRINLLQNTTHTSTAQEMITTVKVIDDDNDSDGRIIM